VPRAQAKRQNVATALCPNCKQQIAYEELDQHMRSLSPPHPHPQSQIFDQLTITVELLDPRWKEQRAKSDLRQSTTNLSTSDVAANLKRLASQRSDVFDGVTGQPVISEEEAARRKKAATSYDGQLEKGKDLERMQGMNIEEQIRQIHQKFKS